MRLNGKDGAGFNARAVEQNGARAAVARVATDVSPGEIQFFAQQLHQEQTRLNHHVAGLPIYLELKRNALSFCRCTRDPPPRARRNCAESQLRSRVSTAPRPSRACIQSNRAYPAAGRPTPLRRPRQIESRAAKESCHATQPRISSLEPASTQRSRAGRERPGKYRGRASSTEPQRSRLHKRTDSV